MQRLFTLLTKYIDYVLFPNICILCKKSGSGLCKHCHRTLPKPESDIPPYIHALYEYRNSAIKKILTDAKYRKRFAGLKSFGRVLYDASLDIISEYVELEHYSNIIFIPVPISKKRMKERGFNQSEILAKAILNSGTNPNWILHTKIIYKILDKTPQASIHNRQDRLKSPVGTFAITTNKNDLEKLQGSLCIIVDDITTTGATISEVRRILLESGAKTAIGLTVAH
jgi:ComF family protein